MNNSLKLFTKITIVSSRLYPLLHKLPIGQNTARFWLVGRELFIEEISLVCTCCKTGISKNVLQFWDLKNVYLLQNQDLKNIIQSIYSVILSGLRIFEILVLDWVHIFWDPSIGSGTHLWDPSIGVGTKYTFFRSNYYKKKILFCVFRSFLDIFMKKKKYTGSPFFCFGVPLF